MLSQAGQSAELQPEPGGLPLERRNALQARAEHGAQARRNAVPAVVQHEGPGRRNAVPAVQHEEQALGRHEEQERLDGEHCRPSVFQAVLIRSLPPRRLRGLPRRLLL